MPGTAEVESRLSPQVYTGAPVVPCGDSALWAYVSRFLTLPFVGVQLGNVDVARNAQHKKLDYCGLLRD